MGRGITGYISTSDIPVLDKITQNVGMEAGRNLLIDHLRECFGRDREYRWLGDPWGFNKTPSHVGLDADAGLIDDSTTRLYIGSTFRNDIAYLPSVVIRQTGSAYKPVSFNQNVWELEFTDQQLIDGYGVITYATRPYAYHFVGLWDSTFEIKITSKSLVDTTAISDHVMMNLTSTNRLSLQQNGLFVRNIRSSGEQTETYGANDPLYVSTVTIETLSEWRRTIPIYDLIERIHICFLLDIDLDDAPPTPAAEEASVDEGLAVYMGARSSVTTAAEAQFLTSVNLTSNETTFEATASSGQFVWFITPASYATPSFIVDGVSGGFMRDTTTPSLTIDGISYEVYRTAIAGLGDLNIEVEE